MSRKRHTFPLIIVALVVGTVGVLVLSGMPSSKNVFAEEIPAWLKEYVAVAENPTKYGLVAPQVHDIKSAKRQIVYTLLSTPLFKGDWFLAHGLLGVTRIPDDINECLYAKLGYKSLFKSMVLGGGTKIERVAECGDGLLLHHLPNTEIPTESWIYWREHYIGAIGYKLNDRFKFNEEGNYIPSPILKPCPTHVSVSELKTEIEGAYQLYDKLRKKGFEDKTLGDSIGMGYVFLRYDDPYYRVPENPILFLPFLEQVYTDTMLAVLKQMLRGMPFYRALEWEMGSRGLNKDDVLLMPWELSREQYLAALKLIIEDLDSLEKSLSKQEKNVQKSGNKIKKHK